MSKSKQETIEDIVREIRQAEVTWHRSEIAQLPTQYLKEWADRIEAAHKRESEAGAEAAQICGEIGELIGREATTEKSSRVGNAAAMREALETISKCDTSKEEDCYTLYRVCEAALSAKPRNCDALSKDEVLKMLEDRSFSKEDTIEWLYDKAEGENDGSK